MEASLFLRLRLFLGKLLACVNFARLQFGCGYGFRCVIALSWKNNFPKQRRTNKPKLRLSCSTKNPTQRTHHQRRIAVICLGIIYQNLHSLRWERKAGKAEVETKCYAYDKSRRWSYQSYQGEGINSNQQEFFLYSYSSCQWDWLFHNKAITISGQLAPSLVSLVEVSGVGQTNVH